MSGNLLRDIQRREETGGYVHKNLFYLAETMSSTSFTDNQKVKLPGFPRATFLMAFSPDHKTMASTHGDHNIHITDLQTGKWTKSLVGHPRTPWCVTFHPSSNDILASGCLGGEVRVWDLNGCSENWVYEKQKMISSLAFHPTEQLLVISAGNEIFFWNWSKSEPHVSVKTRSPSELVRMVQFDGLGRYLLTAVVNTNDDSDDTQLPLGRNTGDMRELMRVLRRPTDEQGVGLEITNPHNLMTPQTSFQHPTTPSVPPRNPRGLYPTPDRGGVGRNRGRLYLTQRQVLDQYREMISSSNNYQDQNLRQLLLQQPITEPLSTISALNPLPRPTLNLTFEDDPPLLQQQQQSNVFSNFRHFLESRENAARTSRPQEGSSNDPPGQQGATGGGQERSLTSTQRWSRLTRMLRDSSSSSSHPSVPGFIPNQSEPLPTIPAMRTDDSRPTSTPATSTRPPSTPLLSRVSSAFSRLTPTGAILVPRVTPTSPFPRVTTLGGAPRLTPSEPPSRDLTPGVGGHPPTRVTPTVATNPPQHRNDPSDRPRPDHSNPFRDGPPSGADSGNPPQPMTIGAAGFKRKGDSPVCTDGRPCSKRRCRFRQNRAAERRARNRDRRPSILDNDEMRRGDPSTVTPPLPGHRDRLHLLSRIRRQYGATDATNINQWSNRNIRTTTATPQPVPPPIMASQASRSLEGDVPMFVVPNPESQSAADDQWTVHFHINPSVEMTTNDIQLPSEPIAEPVLQVPNRPTPGLDPSENNSPDGPLRISIFHSVSEDGSEIEPAPGGQQVIMATPPPPPARPSESSSSAQSTSSSATGSGQSGSWTTFTNQETVNRFTYNIYIHDTTDLETLSRDPDPSHSATTNNSEGLESGRVPTSNTTGPRPDADQNSQNLGNRGQHFTVHRGLHHHYDINITDSSNIHNNALQSAIHRAIAGIIFQNPETTSSYPVRRMSMRLQYWRVSNIDSDHLPAINNPTTNILVQNCHILNDSSVDIAPDGSFIAALSISKQPGTEGIDELSIYSLQPGNFAKCLCSIHVGANAVSVSISPMGQFILVGIGSNRQRWQITPDQLVAQIYKFEKLKTADDYTLEKVGSTYHPTSERRGFMSINSARWLPNLGQGLVYGSSRGDLHICRAGPLVRQREREVVSQPSSSAPMSEMFTFRIQASQPDTDRPATDHGSTSHRNSATQTQSEMQTAGTQTDTANSSTSGTQQPSQDVPQ